MLISRRKEGESLLIGDSIEVRIISVRGKKVVLGIVAPREIKIAAARLTEVELANTAAAVYSSDIDRLLQVRTRLGESAVFLFGGSKEANGTCDKKED